MNKNRLVWAILAGASVTCAAFFIVTASAQTMPQAKTADDAYQQIFQDQIARTKRYEGLLARQEELMKRQEDLMKRQEEGAARFLTICQKWEKQQAQYQKYLDGLGKVGGK